METKKQIKAQLRNEISKEYKNKITRLESEIKSLREQLGKERHEHHDMMKEFIATQEELEQHKDWVRRLQEFMDMDEDTRQQAIEKYRVEESINQQMDALMHSPIFKMFKNILY